MKPKQAPSGEMSYSPPCGPTNINDPKTPGIHGYTYPQGTQGPTACHNDETGRPGLGGSNKGSGTNRG